MIEFIQHLDSGTLKKQGGDLYVLIDKGSHTNAASRGAASLRPTDWPC
ncbi:hypothetical protein [Aliikangiella maris]|uniref:Uncharacterized protein n=1 Tax=Aliikangiella maris TaxID=3162458 RepID=A0ABV2BZR0_9GAMM